MQHCYLWGCVVQQGCILRGDRVQRQVDCLREVAQLELEILVKVQVLRLDVPAEVMDAMKHKHLLTGVTFGPEPHAPVLLRAKHQLVHDRLFLCKNMTLIWLARCAATGMTACCN